VASFLVALHERCTLPASRFKNKLLQGLEASVIERLCLRPVALGLRHEIASLGGPIHGLMFIEEGMSSMTTSFKDGSEVEVSLFGYESVVGMSALMGANHSTNRIYVQIAGCGFSSPMKAAKKEFELGGSFQHLALRYVQAQLAQATQFVGCNAKHHLKERLARWLLLCADRAKCDRFPISHEFLADMLGSTRPTISVAAAAFKARGLVKYSRGVISILDRKGLERRACECYQVVRDQLELGQV
jgi:CRP-like cAMP-binding protein